MRAISTLLIVLSIAVLSIAGCSNRAVYENLQINSRNECSELPPSQYDQCMKEANKSYDEYERERQDLINN